MQGPDEVEHWRKAWTNQMDVDNKLSFFGAYGSYHNVWPILGTLGGTPNRDP